MPTDAPMRRLLDAVTVAVGLAVFAVVMLPEAVRGGAYDFAPLAAAGRLVASGEINHLYAQHASHYNVTGDALFDRAAAEAGFPDVPTPFVYPPLVAAVMQPIARLPFGDLARAWGVISIGLIVAGLWITLATYLPDWRRLPALGLLLIALCAFEPIRYGIWLGQTTAVIFPLVVGAVALARRGRPVPAGLALGLATFIKLTPAVFAALWLWRGPRRAAWWCIGTIATLWIVSVSVVGVAPHRAYLERVAAIGRTLVVAFNNHSFIAWSSRPFYGRGEWFAWRMHEPTTVATAVNVFALAALVVAAALVLRRSRTQTGTPDSMAEGFAFLLTLIAPSISWTHYFVFLLPVLAIAIGAQRQGSVGVSAACAGAFFLCCRPLLMPQENPDVSAGLLRIGAPTVSALLMWVLLCALAVARGSADEVVRRVESGRSAG